MIATAQRSGFRAVMGTAGEDQTTRRAAGATGAQVGCSAACLVVLHGPGVGRRLEIGSSPVLVGRGAEAALILADVSVSRRQFEVWKEGARHRMRNLGAINPTRVNGVPVVEADLRDGDLIAVGTCLLKFVAENSPEASYHEELHRQTVLDPLTGLPNRRHFLECLDLAIGHARTHGECLCLGLIDVDWFKAINDGFGHAAGDQVLRALAQRLLGMLPSDLILARIGGEEFALLLPRRDLDAAFAVAEAMRVAVAVKPFSVERTVHSLTISVGLAELDTVQGCRAELMRAADRALYAAKSDGRNRVRTSG